MLKSRVAFDFNKISSAIVKSKSKLVYKQLPIKNQPKEPLLSLKERLRIQSKIIFKSQSSSIKQINNIRTNEKDVKWYDFYKNRMNNKKIVNFSILQHFNHGFNYFSSFTPYKINTEYVNSNLIKKSLYLDNPAPLKTTSILQIE